MCVSLCRLYTWSPSVLLCVCVTLFSNTVYVNWPAHGRINIIKQVMQQKIYSLQQEHSYTKKVFAERMWRETSSSISFSLFISLQFFFIRFCELLPWEDKYIFHHLLSIRNKTVLTAGDIKHRWKSVQSIFVARGDSAKLFLWLCQLFVHSNYDVVRARERLWFQFMNMVQ